MCRTEIPGGTISRTGSIMYVVAVRQLVLAAAEPNSGVECALMPSKSNCDRPRSRLGSLAPTALAEAEESVAPQ